MARDPVGLLDQRPQPAERLRGLGDALVRELERVPVVGAEEVEPERLGIVARTMSLIQSVLPSDFDIFSASRLTKPLWIQQRTKGLPVAPSDWAISFSWCGKIRSSPPP